MEKLSIQFSKIYCQNPNDFESIGFQYGNSCIEILNIDDFDINKIHSVPTLLIGWEFVKKNFKIKISQKKINFNLYWTFSKSEDKIQQEVDLSKFVYKSIQEYLPKNYKTFDVVLNGNISKKINSIFSEKENFCYFNNSALYVYNDIAFTGINLKSIDFVGKDSQIFIEHILKNFNLIFFNFENLLPFLKEEKFCINTIENIVWACKGVYVTDHQFHTFSPFNLNEKFFPFLMSRIYEKNKCHFIENKEIIKRLSKKDIITDWLSSQSICFSNSYFLKPKYSNKRTITGRINCVDKKFNPQTLPKKSEVRFDIVSRFSGGFIGVFDYVSFETKTAMYLTQNEDFIKKYKDSDFHLETAKVIFNKKDVSQKERNAGKQINHALIYGAGEERIKGILKENNLQESIIEKVYEFLDPIFQKSEEIQKEYSKENIIINPYKTVVHPQKEWAYFNNYIQSTANDIVIDKLFNIKELLSSFKSKFMYQVYDSFVFDFHPEEYFLIGKIKNILEKTGKHLFKTEHRIGQNLMECTTVELEEKNS